MLACSLIHVVTQCCLYFIPTYTMCIVLIPINTSKKKEERHIHCPHFPLDHALYIYLWFSYQFQSDNDDRTFTLWERIVYPEFFFIYFVPCKVFCWFKLPKLCSLSCRLKLKIVIKSNGHTQTKQGTVFLSYAWHSATKIHYETYIYTSFQDVLLKILLQFSHIELTSNKKLSFSFLRENTLLKFLFIEENGLKFKACNRICTQLKKHLKLSVRTTYRALESLIV